MSLKYEPASEPLQGEASADGKAGMIPKCPARILIVEDHWYSPETLIRNSPPP